MRLRTINSRIKYRLSRSKGNVFLTEDFTDLSGRDQVGRALRTLIDQGILVKIGYGLYAKAQFSKIFKKVMPIAAMTELAREALSKLEVETAPTTYERLYHEGKSTQVPTGRVIGVKSRISRKISFNGWEMTYEYVS